MLWTPLSASKWVNLLRTRTHKSPRISLLCATALYSWGPSRAPWAHSAWQTHPHEATHLPLGPNFIVARLSCTTPCVR